MKMVKYLNTYLPKIPIFNEKFLNARKLKNLIFLLTCLFLKLKQKCIKLGNMYFLGRLA